MTLVPQKARTLSRKVDECKPLHRGVHRVLLRRPAAVRSHHSSHRAKLPQGRGFHSSTILLNLSRSCHQNSTTAPPKRAYGELNSARV